MCYLGECVIMMGYGVEWTPLLKLSFTVFAEGNIIKDKDCIEKMDHISVMKLWRFEDLDVLIREPPKNFFWNGVIYSDRILKIPISTFFIVQADISMQKYQIPRRQINVFLCDSINLYAKVSIYMEKYRCLGKKKTIFMLEYKFYIAELSILSECPTSMYTFYAFILFDTLEAINTYWILNSRET